MSTTLCFDFGNTRLKCAVFTGNELTEVVTLPDGSPSAVSNLIKKYSPAKSLLSSVIDHDEQIDEILTESTRFHRLNHLSRIPVTTPVENLKQLAPTGLQW